MKDIDFEELDRAVSSLMSSAPKDDTPSKDDTDGATLVIGSDALPSDMSEDQPDNESVTPATPPAPAEEAVPTVEPAQEPSSIEEAPAPRESISVAPAARRGRFMDVKPSGARGANRPSPSSSVSRHAPALQPIGGMDTASLEESAGLVEPVANEPKVEVDTTASQPDPLGSQGEPATASEPESSTLSTPDQDQPESMPSNATDESLDGYSDDSAPLDSPFLPDAKVEKRPLGRPAESVAAPVVDLASELAEGGQESDTMNSTSLDDVSSISPNKDAQLPEQPLPAELSSDLLSIETGGETFAQESRLEPTATAPAPEMAASESQQSAQAPQVPPAQAMTPASASRVAAASIPQQYKVQPAKDDESPAASAIYDAQPLSHPAKKKPGWFWVVAIVMLIVLGVGGGVAVYYLGMN